MRIVLTPPSKQNLLLRSLAIALGLMIFKSLVFGLTNSVSLLASAADSFLDFLVSFANFMLIRSAIKPADHDHPYGHGKIESLAGLFQSLLIGGAAIGIAGMSVHRFLHPVLIGHIGSGIAVVLVSLGVNIWHIRNLRSSMVRTDSQIMATEYLHYASDILVYIGVIVSFLLTRFTGVPFWDPLISLLIVIYLIKAVAAIMERAVSELLDEQLPDDVLKEIDQSIKSFHSKIVAYHDLRTRKVGATKFIEFHVELSNVERFDEAHKITSGLIFLFQEKYAGAIVTVHADPVDHRERSMEASTTEL